MQLPSPISSWSELLAEFPKDIEELVLNLVHQLSYLVDNIPIVEEQGEVEPDGIDGVGRSIQYERLLLSEWSLLEQFPEEFIRRAVSGEHLFYELKNVEQKENRSSYALFDCGPTQLGKPRLVQLALLFLLARRAEKNNAEFYWGVLQNQKIELNHGLSKESVKLWLQQRSVEIADDDLLRLWKSTLINHENQINGVDHEKDIDADDLLKDLWVVSKSSIDNLDTNARQILIDEPLLEPDLIDVELKTKASVRKKSLNLADEELNVKIIRNPFSKPNVTPYISKLCLDGEWVSSSNGRRVGIQDNTGVVTFYSIHISNPKKTKQNYEFHIPKGRTLLGMYLTKKRTVALCTDRNHFYIHNYPGSGQIKKIDKKQSIQINEKDYRLLNMVITHGENGVNTLHILDSKGHLRALNLTNNQTLFSTVSENVISLGTLSNCDYYVEFDSEKSELTIFWYLGSYHRSRKTFTLESGLVKPKILISGSGSWHKGSVGCLAFETNNSVWKLICGKNEKVITVEDDDLVLGAWSQLDRELEKIENKKRPSKLDALIVLKSDRQSLVAVDEKEEILLHTLTSGLIKGELNLGYFFLHYMNENKELIVLDIIKGKELLRLDEAGRSLC